MSLRRGMMLCLTLARRELRTGLKGFGVFLGCLFLGVFAISAVGSFSTAARTGLIADARDLLGGDVSIRLTHRPMTDEQQAFIGKSGHMSELVEMRAMARTDTGATPQLVELKAVDSSYPLYGSLTLAPSVELHDALDERNGRYGAAVDPLLLDRLGLTIGDTLFIGEGLFEIRASIVTEPDRNVRAFTLGPRVLVSLKSIPSTQLITPASLVRYVYNVRFFEQTILETFLADLKNSFPRAGWRIRPYTEAAPRIRTLLDRLASNLTLAGLAALLLGGLGVSGAVRGYLAGRTRHIAAMKCLGATSATIFTTYLLQVVFLALLGTLAGMALGSVVPFAAAGLLGHLIPIPIKAQVYPLPLLLAGSFGLLTALLFSLGSLGRAMDVPPASLFRGYVDSSERGLRPGTAVMIVCCALLLALLVFITSEDRRLAFWFVLGTAATFLVFRLLAAGVVRLAGRIPKPAHPSLRLALSNIPRPGSPARGLISSIGIGLTVLTTVALVQGNLSAYVEQGLPDQAPSFFVIDLLPAQTETFDRLLASEKGFLRSERRPTLRGRIVAINGTSVDEATISPDVAWAVRGDRALTYAAQPPEDAKIVSGNWWPTDYEGPPRISLTSDLAAGFGVGVGDSLTLNILGREVTAAIASLREVDWSTLSLEFAIIFDPDTLRNAPQTYLASIYVTPEREGAVLRSMSNALPNVTVVRIKEVLENVSRLIRRLGYVFKGLGGVVLLAGFLVLAGAVAADQHRRLYDTVIFKVCGATRKNILLALAAEFGLVGIVSGLLSGLVGGLAAYGVVTHLMEIEYRVLPGTLLATLAAGLLFSVAFGLIGTSRTLKRSPSTTLRNE